MADVHGKFVWHELMNTDPQAVASFYDKVLGWKPQAWDKDPSYTVWLGSKGPAAGAMRHADGAPPSQWLAYTGVPDMGAAIATAQKLGGRVVKEAADLPDGGKYAILADPQGAQFGVFTPPANATSGSDMTSEFSWHELGTTDYTAALRFYRELFGWEQLEAHDMGPMGLYVLFGRGGTQLGGMFNRPASMPGEPSWVAYANVRDASRAADAAKSSGGRILNGPHEVPGGSWIVQMLDPLGAMIAVVEPPRAAAAKPAETPKAAAKAAPKAKPAPAPASPAPAAKKAAPPAPPKPAKKTAKPATKTAVKAPKKAAKKAAKTSRATVRKTAKAKKSNSASKRSVSKRTSVMSRAKAVAKQVVRRVLRKKRSSRGRRRR